MNKKIATILFLSPFLMINCSNTAAPNNTASPNPSSDTYITENIIITNGDDALKRLKEGNINSIVDKILPNINDSDDLNDAIKDNIESVYKQVQEDEIVKELVHEGKLKVAKAYYSLDGKVDFD